MKYPAGRRALLLGASILGLLVVAAVVVLRSSWATHQIAERLAAQYGGPVKLAGSDIGLLQIQLRGVELFETSADEGDSKIWASAESIQLDAPLWRLLGGALPREITLEGGDVTLRFDREGRLLTRLPTSSGGQLGNFGQVHLRRCRLVIQQEGRPDLIVHRADLDVSPSEGRLALSGNAETEAWGAWSVGGSYNPTNREVTLTLQSPKVTTSAAKLEGLPFVPPAVWREIRLSGSAAVEMTFSASLDPPAVHYRIALEPQDMQATLVLADLNVTQANSGRIVIDDGLVELQKVRCRVADGGVLATAELDFRQKAAELHFVVRANGVKVKDLPAKWHLPPQIEGRLTGDADLSVTVAGDTLRTRGRGEGVIREATFAGVPADPITLRLVAAGDHFQFTSEMSGVRSPVPPAAIPLVLTGLVAAPLQPPSLPPSLPTWLITGATEGVIWLTKEFVAGGQTALRQAQRGIDVLSGKEKLEGYAEARLTLRDVDVAQFLRGLKANLPVAVTGRGSFSFKLQIPLSDATDLRNYRLDGTADATWLEVSGLRLEKVHAAIIYRDGILRLDELTGRVPATPPGEAGRFTGSGQVGVIPAGDVVADVTLTSIPLARIAATVPALAEGTSGAFSGKAHFSAPLKRLREPASWQLSADVSSARFALGGIQVSGAAAAVQTVDGVLLLTTLRASVEGSAFTGGGRLGLATPYAYTGTVEIKDGNGETLQLVARRYGFTLATSGTFHATSTADGTLEPVAIHSRGSFGTHGLTVQGISLQDASVSWDQDADRVRISDLSATLGRGTIRGRALIPLRPRIPGDIDVVFEKVDVGSLTKAVAVVPFAVRGDASGSISGAVGPVLANGKREFTGAVDLQASRLVVQNIPTDRLRGTVTYRRGEARYDLTGDALGGQFQLNGLLPLLSAPTSPAPSQGRLRVEGLRLERLAAVWNSDTVKPLRGRVDLDVAYRHEEGGWLPVGSGELLVRDVLWNDQRVVDRFRSAVVVRGPDLILEDFTGALFGGIPTGRLVYHWQRPVRGWFMLNLERAEAGSVLAFWPALGSRLRGSFDLRLHGRIGTEWDGDGTLTLSRGSVAGLEATGLSVPFDFRLSPGQGRAEVSVRDLAAQVARGQVTGRMTLGLGSGSHMEGHLRFLHLDLPTLVRSTGVMSRLAAGRVSGTLDFSGSDVRSLDDVSGVLQATLEQTQALQLPVLNEIGRYVLPGQPPVLAFQSGDIQARLDRGIVRLRHLNLASDLVQVTVEGTITVQGRLDLRVNAHTGLLGPNVPLLSRLGVRIPTSGALPLGLVTQVTGLLSNRLIRLHVGGTVRSPSIQIDPLALLSDEAVRFFLAWATGGTSTIITGSSLLGSIP